MNKINVIFFVTALDSGGLENYLLRFLKHSGSNFGNIVVFCKGGKGGQLEDAYLEVSNLSIVKHSIRYLSIKDYRYLYTYLKNNSFSAVCDFTGNFAGFVLLIAKWCGINKRIAFYRGSSNHFKETLLRLLYNYFSKMLVYFFATDILSNSKAAFNFFFPKKWGNDKRFKVIYNGINPKPFMEEKGNLREEFDIPLNAFVVGHTGRFNEAKNHTTIIKVATKLCKQHEDVYFLLCGNGVKDNLQSTVEHENLEQKISLSNNRSDIPKFLKTLDCYYFPSVTEGQPNALIEAMVCGLPIVASDIEPIKECVSASFQNELILWIDMNRYTVRLRKKV